MSRIDRLARTARHEAGMALLFFFAAVAAGVWAVAAAQPGTALFSATLAFAAVIALCLSIVHLRECVRVCDLALREMEWEASHE